MKTAAAALLFQSTLLGMKTTPGKWVSQETRRLTNGLCRIGGKAEVIRVKSTTPIASVEQSAVSLAQRHSI
jgi:hypothetical protein